jgi:hypothetical protein
MRIAIIHYWWLSNRGGEAVVEALFDLYPNADLFLHVSDDDEIYSVFCIFILINV